MRIIKVQGNGQASLPADTVRLTFNIECERFVYGDCVDELNNRVDQLRTCLAECNIEQREIKTSDFNITINQEYKNGRYNLIGYRARHGLTLEIPFFQNTLNAVLNAIAKGGSNTSVSIAFSCSDKAQIKKMVLEDAVRKARTNAEIMTAAAGVVLGDLVTMDYGWSEVRFYSDDSDMSICESGTPSPNFEPDDIKAMDMITMVYEIH